MVLLVDDSRVQRRILSALMDRWGYQVCEAQSGEEALGICREQHVDLVISDWMMPGMTGLEFCKAFRALNREGYGYFILLTSKSEIDEMVHGLQVGADDFLTKPVATAELRARLSSGERILKMQRELNEKNRIIRSALDEIQGLYDAVDRDLVQARKIQESLVPQEMMEFGENRVSFLIKPCGHVGGDLVGAFSPGKNRLAFYNIDVSGHGVTSALMTARLAGYLSGRFLEHNVAVERRFEKFFALRQPQDVARILNERLLSDSGVAEYFTMTFAIADLTNGQCRVLQAGHPHPMLQRRDGTINFVGGGGIPVGLIKDAPFEDFVVQLQPGDRLMFYSDGFTECTGKSGQMLEEAGLQKMVQALGERTGPEMLNDLFWMLQSDRNGLPLEDDVSATLFEYAGPEP